MIPTWTRALQTRWSGLSVRQRGSVIIAIPVVCLMTTLAASIWLQQNTLRTRAEVEQAETILKETESLAKSLVDAETSIRGYDITRQDDDLEPYQTAVDRLPKTLNQLRQWVTDPQQQQRLQTIEQLTGQKLQVLQRNLRTVNQLDPPLQTSPELNALLAEGRAVMDQLRQEIDAFVAVENQFLTQRQASLVHQEIIILVVLVLAVLVGMIAALFAKYLFDDLERELAEQREHLYESKTRLQAIVDHVADGILTFRSDGTIESFNPAAQRIFGDDAAEIIGQNIQRLLSDLPQQRQELRQWIDHANGGGPQEITGYRRSGEPFLVEMAVSSIQLDRQALYVGVLRDVTVQKQTAEKLRLYAQEQAHTGRALAQTARILRRRNQELDQFAYVVSHDLKAPLRAIANLSEWLEEDLNDKLTPDTRHQLDLLRGRVHRMEALITGLLQYSRAGRLDGQPETVAVGALLQEIIDSLAPGPEFRIEVEPGMPTLVTERLPLQQVFSNLLSNALKHHHRQPGDPPGRIRISSREQPIAGTSSPGVEVYEFAIADDGPGIEPQYHDKVFGIFQTLEPWDKAENTGIGLALVKKIIESRGGKIWIESQPFQGTTFWFQWPKHFQPQRITEPWKTDP